VGPTNLADRTCCIGRGLSALRAESGIDVRFLLHYLRHTEVRLREEATGSTFEAISGNQLGAHEVRVAPVGEQDRIVAAIEQQLTRLDEAEAALERVQRNLKRYRAAVLQAAVEGRLVPTEAELARTEGRSYEPASELLKRVVGKRRRPEASDECVTGSTKRSEARKDNAATTPATPRTASVPDLPEGWCWVTCETVARDQRNSICAGPFGTIFKARDFRSQGVPIIFLRHVKPDRYLTTKPTFMDPERWSEVFQEYSVHGGEVLVTKLGDPPGDAAIFPQSLGAAMLTPDVIKLDANSAIALPRFVMHYLNSTTARRLAFGSAFGTTRLRLTLPLFRTTPVPLPPRAEQERIVADVDRRLTIADEQAAVVDRAIRRCQQLRQAILRWAFEGKLVDQESSDEPASVLLERIRAERAARAEGNRKKAAVHRKRYGGAS
jgi:type I restriction enzyme S subunit